MTGVSRFRRMTPTAVLAAAVMAVSFSSASSATESLPVRIEITNAKSGSMVRCQLVLAHFVTLESDKIEPNHRTTIALRRDVRAGTLLYPRAGGPPMALENIFCGLDEDWAATRNDLDLTRLRGGGQNRLKIICDGQQGLACAVAPSTSGQDE